MSEENNTVELKEEDSEKIAGGTYIYQQGARKSSPCKYCKATDSLVYNRGDTGWRNGQSHTCNVFRCEKCGGDNYFSNFDDGLL